MNGRRINARAIVVRGNKILAVKHINSEGVEAEYWAVSGGGLDLNESLADGVRREVYEELGVRATVEKLLFIQQFSSQREGWQEELEFFFQVEDSKQYDHIDLSKTSHGANELGRVEFVDPKKVKILPRFLSEVDIADCVVNDRPVRIYDNIVRRPE